MTETLTIADLEQLGFTQEQITRLSELRAVYPVIEFVSSEEWRRLVFLKWRCTRAGLLESSER